MTEAREEGGRLGVEEGLDLGLEVGLMPGEGGECGCWRWGRGHDDLALLFLLAVRCRKKNL